MTAPAFHPRLAAIHIVDTTPRRASRRPHARRRSRVLTIVLALLVLELCVGIVLQLATPA